MSNDRKTLAKYGAQIPTGPRTAAKPGKPVTAATPTPKTGKSTKTNKSDKPAG
ncbi:MAG: hypothetical protein IV094_12040 [Vitreoscilla sp.]|nr:hypothetical protein [Vitreoscilla sp.]